MSTSPTASAMTCECPATAALATVRVLTPDGAFDVCTMCALQLVGSAERGAHLTVVVGGDPQVCPGCAHWKQAGQACGKCGHQ